VALKIRNALIGDQTLSSDQLKELAALPSKEELVVKLVGQLHGQLAGLVHVLNNPLVRLAKSLNSPSSGLVNVLNSRVQQVS
jgi:ribosomal protein L10